MYKDKEFAPLRFISVYNTAFAFSSWFLQVVKTEAIDKVTESFLLKWTICVEISTIFTAVMV